ncbi:MAG: AMP-binding protein [Betaproteobacteria bacterium]
MTGTTAFNLAERLAQSARRWPDAPAVARGLTIVHDYAALALRVATLGAALRAMGLGDGVRVAIVSRNGVEYIEALYACWWAGLVAVPVNAKLHPRELAFILDDCGARCVLVDREWATTLPALAANVRVVEFGSGDYRRLFSGAPIAAPARCDRDAAAWLFYTSGTTGRPKGVVITHANLDAMATCFVRDVEAILPGDAILHPAPLSHGSGLYVVPHIAGGAVNVVPESGGFDADEVAKLVSNWNRALLFAAPTMVKRLVRSPALAGAGLERLKCIVFGGGPMYVADCREAFAALGPRLAQIYGQGESPMTITAMDRATLADAIARGDDTRLASVGTAQSGVELRIDAGSKADAPAAGEVLVRAPTVMRGYWNNPAATAAALADGWLHTGDIGTLAADGYLTLKDRSKDLIISGGSNIYPREVEEVLQQHSQVAEVAVVGRPHGEWGEEVVACVVVRDGADAQAVERECDALCIARIARFKRPKAYVFVTALPKNNAGKVLKTELRGIVAAR